MALTSRLTLAQSSMVTDASGAAGAASVSGTSRKILSTQPFDSRLNWTSKISRPYEPATRSAMARILSMSCVGSPSKTKSGHRPTPDLAGYANTKGYRTEGVRRSEGGPAGRTHGHRRSPHPAARPASAFPGRPPSSTPAGRSRAPGRPGGLARPAHGRAKVHRSAPAPAG